MKTEGTFWVRLQVLVLVLVLVSSGQGTQRGTSRFRLHRAEGVSGTRRAEEQKVSGAEADMNPD